MLRYFDFSYSCPSTLSRQSAEIKIEKNDESKYDPEIINSLIAYLKNYQMKPKSNAC